MLRVKDTVKDCGRETQILCLTGRGANYIPDDLIQQMDATMRYCTDQHYLALKGMFSGKDYRKTYTKPISEAFLDLRRLIGDVISDKVGDLAD